MNDKDIRKVLINHLTENNLKIINELHICDGLVIADVVTIGEDIIGYEIKSDVDTLVRFKNQKTCYEKTFDYNYLVVGEKYRDVEVPLNWGLIVVNDKGLEVIIEANENDKVDSMSLLELLWKDEMKLMLQGIKGISNKNKRKLRSMILKNFNQDQIKDYVIKTLLSREGWKDV